MANNYTTWSEYIPFKSKEEASWMKDVLRLNISEYENLQNEDLDNAEMIQHILSSFGINIHVDDAEYFPGFETHFSDNDAGVSIYAVECGNVEVAANVLQEFLNKFRPNEYLSIEFANTCSKPRAGEFGGGAVFITANAIKYFHTGSWICEQISNFENTAKE